jgi:hypothetical protein
MDISKATIGFVAAACIVGGAAGGSWLVSRGNDPASTVTEQPAGDLAASGGVEQSEGVIADVPASEPIAPAAQPLVAPPPPPSRPAPNRQAVNTRRPTTSGRDQAPPASVPAAQERAPIAAPVEAPRAFESDPVRPSTPPEPQFVDLVVPSDAVIGLQVETSVSSETARVEDQVVARVTRDVKVGDRVAIPSGSRAQGEVTVVERGGKLKDRARLGVRFTSIVLADGTRVPIETDTIFREGDAQATRSAAKIGGGAIGGAIIGGILGGAKGAVIGSTAGAGAGTAAVMAGGRSEATLSPGAPVTVRLQQPATVTVDK